MILIQYKWSRKNGYEVSSKGDKRFSAFYAKFKNGKSIEEVYQLDIKGYRIYGNDPMLGKGGPPLNNLTKKMMYRLYKNLWIKWCKENPSLVQELINKLPEYDYTLKDRFANSKINQARALSEILNKWGK